MSHRWGSVVGLLGFGAQAKTNAVEMRLRLGTNFLVAAEGEFEKIESLVQAPLARFDMLDDAAGSHGATRDQADQLNDVELTDGQADRCGRMIVAWGGRGAPDAPPFAMGLAGWVSRGRPTRTARRRRHLRIEIVSG